MSMVYFEEELEYILAVTKTLNGTKLPESEHFYIHVELRDAYDHKRVGKWSDEHGDEAWYFQEDSGDHSPSV